MPPGGGEYSSTSFINHRHIAGGLITSIAASSSVFLYVNQHGGMRFLIIFEKILSWSNDFHCDKQPALDNI